MDASEAAEYERRRCVAIVELTMLESPPECQHALIRVLNSIANGAEPITMKEQLAKKQAAAKNKGQVNG